MRTGLRALALSAAAFAALLVTVPQAGAGTITGDGAGCNLSSPAPDCKWTPSTCLKPDEPVFRVRDVNSYNRSVEAYNSWVASMNVYLQCLTTEANADMAKKVPLVVNKSVDSLQNDAQGTLETVKNKLESEKSRLPR